MMCQVLLDPGDTAWLEDPGYTGRPGGAHGCRGAHRADPGRWRWPRRRRRHPPRARARLAYVTPAHQFPLACRWRTTPARAAGLGRGRARAWILEDDYDCGFHYGSRPTPCLQSLDADGRVIYIGSFSKTVFPAMRLGFVIVPPDLRAAMASPARARASTPPVLDQGVLADLMEPASSSATAADAPRIPPPAGRPCRGGRPRHGRGLFTLRPVHHRPARASPTCTASTIRRPAARRWRTASR
jgi:GntR family transcriptional regulator/MocR family aminotransferase